MEQDKILKRIYTISLLLLISFWSVVIVGGISVYRITDNLHTAQIQLEKAGETIEGIDIDTLNDTIKTLNKTVKPLKDLLGK